MQLLPTRRIERLRQALPGSVEQLRLSRKPDLPPGFVEDYVALSWLEWHGGLLRVTSVGEELLKRLDAKSAPVRDD